MTADDVIDEARGFHETFAVDQHTRKLCLQELRRAQLALYSNLSYQGVLAADAVFTAADIATALAGTPLPLTPIAIRKAAAFSAAGIVPVSVTQDEQDALATPLRLRLLGHQLYIIPSAAVQAQVPSSLIDAWRSAWDDILVLRVTHTPTPAAVTLLTDTLTAPDFTRRFLVGSLVRFLVTRSTRVGDAGPALMSMAGEMMAAVLAEAEERGAHEATWYVQQVVR